MALHSSESPEERVDDNENQISPSNLSNGTKFQVRQSEKEIVRPHSSTNTGDKPRVSNTVRNKFTGRPSLAAMSGRTQSERSIQERNEIRRKLSDKHKSKIPFRVQWTTFMFSQTKNHLVAMLGEFIGTFLFLFFAFAGTTSANAGAGDSTAFDANTQLYISLSFGFSLMVNAWIFFRISGGLFNPAVTLALALLGALNLTRAVLIFITQISAACFSAYIVSVLYPVPFSVQTTLTSGTSNAQGIFIEALCTAELVFTIIMLAKEKHRATFMAPIGIGIAFFIAEMSSVYYTGGSLNPARSFGPAAATQNFLDTQWIYWVGPLIGSLLATGVYKMFKLLEFELVTPGQDGDMENDPTQNPNHELAHIVMERQAEVEEIQAIEQEGGFANLSNGINAEPSVLDDKGVIGMAVEGVRHGDEIYVVRKRSGDQPDLEAQWGGRHVDGSRDPRAEHMASAIGETKAVRGGN